MRPPPPGYGLSLLLSDLRRLLASATPFARRRTHRGWKPSLTRSLRTTPHLCETIIRKNFSALLMTMRKHCGAITAKSMQSSTKSCKPRVGFMATECQGKAKLTPAGFEPAQLSLVELESTPLDRSGKVSCSFDGLAKQAATCNSARGLPAHSENATGWWEMSPQPGIFRRSFGNLRCSRGSSPPCTGPGLCVWEVLDCW